MRFSNIQLLPALWVMTSYSASGSTPSRMPSAIASAAAAMCTPASSWLIDLHLAAGRHGRPADRPCRPSRRARRRRGVGLGPPRRHHGHLAGGGLGRAAGDRRIEVQQAALVQPLLQRDRPIRVDRRTHHEDAARASSPAPQPPSPNSTLSVCAALTTTLTTTSQRLASSAGLAQAAPPRRRTPRHAAAARRRHGQRCPPRRSDARHAACPSRRGR